MMLSVAIIDDHELVRTGFRLILGQHADIQVVGEAGDGESGLALLRSLAPQVALVDVHMPGVSGIEVTERARRLKLPTRIIIVSMVGEAPFPKRLLEAGASGYVTKGCAANELIRAVRQVADGRRYLAPEIAEAMALSALGAAQKSPFEALSSRELEVSLALARGEAMQRIAERLNLSAKTVATYKYRVFEKLGIDNAVTLAHLAHLYGLIDAPTSA
ncbi:MAG TPA: response regulator [Dokdonella sp.]|uniref:response regulator n=1 Tax=Dokdonella sp. TaxID=2291710 RepID=UPI0025B8C09F|nr:response regulator [Dokdonella sp.]MBX3692823.1 response regulator [Dokdonella sp.]MCW5567782.1 response regulator [Dokdonella sp.]HNR91033.1 response regulator [Dokdonella sp.]